jgi:hypothetical protein
MSLEQVLADNTAAVKDLTSIIRGAFVATPATAATEPTKTKGAKKPAATEQPSEAAKAAPAVATGPSLNLVTDTVLDFAAENSAKAKEILKSFKATRITELKPEVYPDVLKAVEAAKAAIAAELLAGNDDSPESLV